MTPNGQVFDWSAMKFKPALLRFKLDLTNASSEYALTGPLEPEEQTDCNGHTWSMNFSADDGQDPEENLACFELIYHNKEPLYIKYTISVKNAKGVVIEEETRECDYDESFGPCEPIGLLCTEHSRIFDIANNLKNDALLVELTIQVKDKLDQLCDPEELKAHQNKGLQFLKNQVNADLSVNVDGKIFHVHSLILDNYAPILADFCKQRDSTFGGISSRAFQRVLEYVYSGKRPSNWHIIRFGKEIIDAANRFELVELKLAIERVLVHELIVDKENVADYIVFADAKSCPLLKEYAISFFLLHAKEILNSDNSKALRESGELLIEIMKIMADRDEHETEMTVNELREELKKRKLDIDGSKEALLSIYEEAKRQRNE